MLYHAPGKPFMKSHKGEVYKHKTMSNCVTPLATFIFLCYVEYKKQRKLTYIVKYVTSWEGDIYSVYISKPAVPSVREDVTKYII